MNLLLLESHQINNNRAEVSGRRAEHIFKVLKLTSGDRISLGLLNGKMGSGIIESSTKTLVQIRDIQLDQAPPANLPLTLILAMPRPQMLKRILQTVATMGVKKLCLIQTGKVEKGFWQSPSATPEAIREHLILGLEQGMATQLPELSFHQRFRPFAEDELPELVQGTTKIIAHPGSSQACPKATEGEHISLAIGPEGGFTDKEVDYFVNAGFSPVHLGDRILKVETAVPVLLAKLF